jgi:hypothetical protein
MTGRQMVSGNNAMDETSRSNHIATSSLISGVFWNGVTLNLLGIPPISAKNAEMDGARKLIAKRKML